MMFYKKNDGSLTIKEHEARIAPHEVINEDTSACPICGLAWRHDDEPCSCKDVVEDLSAFDADEVFNLLQPLIEGAYELGLNPLPSLRKLFGDSVKISYWNGECFGAMRNAPMSDVLTGKVTVLVDQHGFCRFWLPHLIEDVQEVNILEV